MTRRCENDASGPAEFIASEGEYGGCLFESADCRQVEFVRCQFHDCTFRRCNFAESIWRRCRFVNCRFESCDLSLCALPDSVFSSTRFEDSRVIGVNWTEAAWPEVRLGDPIAFVRCSVSHSTFFGLDLQRLSMRECVAVDVDWREADLRQADLRGSDLAESLFQGANLSAADLRGARNYQIAAGRTTITRARFSMPEALSLLTNLEIDLSE